MPGSVSVTMNWLSAATSERNAISFNAGKSYPQVDNSELFSYASKAKGCLAHSQRQARAVCSNLQRDSRCGRKIKGEGPSK